MSTPYLVLRGDLADDDESEAVWLERHPNAILFGVDDGIVAAFTDPNIAAAWLIGILLGDDMPEHVEEWCAWARAE
jgi:hypothetical protein